MKAKFSPTFYFILLLLVFLTALGWYTTLSMSNETVFDENGEPMPRAELTVLILAMSIILISWTASAIVLILLALRGTPFCIDENGINDTAGACILLAFIFVVPIRRIPYSAIRDLYIKEGALVAEIDKTAIKVFPLFRIFIRREYRFFASFAKYDAEELEHLIGGYVATHAENTNEKTAPEGYNA